MLAAWYERPGPAAEVLQIGQMADPKPGPGEVRVRVTLSAINPRRGCAPGDINLAPLRVWSSHASEIVAVSMRRSHDVAADPGDECLRKLAGPRKTERGESRATK